MGAISERRVMSNTLRRYDVLATTANGNSAVLDTTKKGSTVIGEFISVAYSVTTRIVVAGGCTLVAMNGSPILWKLTRFRLAPPRRLTARTVARHFPCN
jgi:hypothetical protein